MNRHAMAGVKIWQVNIRDCGMLSRTADANNIPGPYLNPQVVCPEYQGLTCTYHIEGHPERFEVAVR